MVMIKSFKAVRPRKDLVKKIASQPYDVLNSDEARLEAKGNPYSFLHVVKSEIDLPENTGHYEPIVYEQAADNLQNMIEEGWMILEKKEAMYLYRQIMNGHSQYGLVVSSSVQDYVEGKIKIHELTREVKEKDRITHVDTVNANTGPVFLTYPANNNLDSLFENIASESPEYDFTADDDIQHTIWIIKEEELQKEISMLFSEIPYTYVADGHHRSKSAAMVGKARKDLNPKHNGKEEYNWFLSVLFPHNQLKILDYNRVVKDLNGLSTKDFLTKLKQFFEINSAENKEKASPVKKTDFAMYLENKWYRLQTKNGIYDAKDPVDSLDVSILQKNVLTDVLGIGDIRSDERIDFVGGIRGLGELEKRVNSGEMKVAFALWPTSIEELMSIADAGKIMPPKSTWFEPKLRSGLLVHLLD